MACGVTQPTLSAMIQKLEEELDVKIFNRDRKHIAFGLIYGIGAKLLAVKLSDPKSGIIVTPEEAQKEMDIFFGQHPKLANKLESSKPF